MYANAEDTLPDILKQLHDVLDSLRTYLQTQQQQNSAASNSGKSSTHHSLDLQLHFNDHVLSYPYVLLF